MRKYKQNKLSQLTNRKPDLISLTTTIEIRDLSQGMNYAQ